MTSLRIAGRILSLAATMLLWVIVALAVESYLRYLKSSWIDGPRIGAEFEARAAADRRARETP